MLQDAKTHPQQERNKLFKGSTLYLHIINREEIKRRPFL